MAGMKVSWMLISPEGRLVEKLAGKPNIIAEGFSIRCEEVIYSHLGSGSFHFNKNASTGTANMAEELMRFRYEIVVEGPSIFDIETIRESLKIAIGVTVKSA